MFKRLNYLIMKMKIFVLRRKMTHARYNCFQYLKKKSTDGDFRIFRRKK